ncbi:MAG TPA: undecaprenyl-phosphate glucose phosphotransferase [Flavisolibacter sp.]|jgi:putative colanic acid biosynthesis UDP-glucose lipid carrier transferase|nr:undecaprenyl-phosphate glucose phosphotransferase [Flavisolibacter sp.]
MQRNSKLFESGKFIADLLTLALIIIVSRNLLVENENILSLPNLVVLATVLVVWMIAGRTTGLWEDLTFKPFSIEWIVFGKALVVYSLLLSFIFFQLSSVLSFRTHQFLLHCGVIFFLFPIQKLLVRKFIQKVRNSKNLQRKVLIVGANNTGFDFYEHYIRGRRYGYVLAGFIDDERQPTLNGHYLGKVNELDRIVTEYELDDIIVTLPITNEVQIKKILTTAEREGKRVRIIPNYENFSDGKMHVDNLGKLSVITLRSLPLDSIDNKIQKRIFDIGFSFVVIVLLLSWLIPILSILIKLTSRGPVFFKQARWGLNNKTITCYKFRSMYVSSRDVDAKGNYQQAKKNDPRVTPVGRILRKTNLDELPQFFNVLFGSMSVVGPRPHPLPLNEISKDSVEGYMTRHWVKPGITGWAQVNGYRGETNKPYLMQKRVEHDIWYMENWSHWLDLQIILQTLINMIKGEKSAF